LQAEVTENEVPADEEKGVDTAAEVPAVAEAGNEETGKFLFFIFILF